MQKDNKPPRISIYSKKSEIPPSTQKPKRAHWSFSFKYFNQINGFGLQSVQNNWFVSFIERLKELNKIDFENIFAVRNGLRYHAIDWEAKNIPITREAFTWIDKEYLENDTEFPFYQFHISRALGRFVGFWNENHDVFFVVLLDPKHNIQPSKLVEYRIRPSNPLNCQYSTLLMEIEKVKNRARKCPTCNIISDLSRLPDSFIETNAVIFFLDDSYLQELKIKLGDFSLSEIIENGLLNMV